MARRPYNVNPSTRHRGPIFGSSGAAEGAPSAFLNTHYGLSKLLYNGFTRAADIDTTAGTGRLTLTAINAGTTVTTSGILTGRFHHMTGLSTDISSVLGTGVQYVEGPAASLGYISSSGTFSRSYAAPTVMNFTTTYSSSANVNNNYTVAPGLMSTVAVLTGAGAVASGGGQQGCFFRVPIGSGGVSGVVECVTVAGGTVQATTVTGRTVASTTPAGANAPNVRFAIRVVLDELSAAANPILSGSSRIEFWMSQPDVAGGTDEALVATHTAIALPNDLRPGYAITFNAGTSPTINIPFWALSVGPMQ